MTTEQRKELYDDLDAACGNLDDIYGTIQEAQKGKYGELSKFVSKLLEDIKSEISEIQDQIASITNRFEEIINEE